MKWLPILCLILVGCGSSVPTKSDRDYTEETIIAHIAIASAGGVETPVPSVKPKVGDKCPVCADNNPRTGCPVGKTGDGRTCNVCLTCNGDGKIDGPDLQMGPTKPIETQVPSEPAVVSEKELTLHMTPTTRGGWPSAWYASERESFELSGWKVRVILEPSDASGVAYFDAVATNGDVLQFYQPVSLKDKTGHINIRHLETR
jgi:hypothetical protein